MRRKVKMVGAAATMLCVAAAPGGQAGSALHVSATVIRPVPVDTRPGPGGALLVANAGGANVTARGAIVVRQGRQVRVLLPAAAAVPVFVTIEY